MNLPQTINNNPPTKAERIEARVNPELKKRLQYAADLRNSSLSEFLLRSAEKAANEVINEYKILRLTADDSNKFANAIFNPPKPNSKLKKAYTNYKKEISSRK